MVSASNQRMTLSMPSRLLSIVSENNQESNDDTTTQYHAMKLYVLEAVCVCFHVKQSSPRDWKRDDKNWCGCDKGDYYFVLVMGN